MKLHPGYEERPNDSRFVDCVKTPLTEEEATYYLRTAWKNVLGAEPSVDSLALLWAKSLGETGRWQLLRCNNWGNIKKKPHWKYTSYDAGEILNGKHEMFYPYHPQTHFAAWDTPLEGAEAYVRLISDPKGRYYKAWQVVITTGDPVQYTLELKKAGYFTAKLEVYTKGMVRLTSEFKTKASRLMAWEPPQPEPEPESLQSKPATKLEEIVPESPQPSVEQELLESEPLPLGVKVEPSPTFWATFVALLSRFFLFWKK